MRFLNDVLMGLLLGIPVLAALDLGTLEVTAGPIAYSCTDTRNCCGSNDKSKGDRCDSGNSGCTCQGSPNTSCKSELNSAGVCLG
jgi:hypothetical protein